MKYPITFLLLLLSIQLSAQINLPSFFSDNMVLQRNAEVKFWGWGNRNANVKITPSWTKKTITVKSSGHGRFITKLSTPEAGGPYTIDIQVGTFTKQIKNILIGEVWLCSGQSNMQWNSNNKLQEMLDELPNAKNDNVRLLNVSNVAALTPQQNFFDTWKESNPQSAVGFSAIAYFYAKKLSATLNVPVGVINASWGGTAAEVWTPSELVFNDPELKQNSSKQLPSASKPHEPGALWNSMINPLVGYQIAGVLWYQGETNAPTHSGYHKLFTTMINAWRNAWGYEFPFYYAQIAPYTYKSKPEEQQGALLREAQTKTLALPKTAMVVLTDLVPDVTNIHPTRKKEVADRFADIALSETYGKVADDVKSPVYKSHTVDGNKIIVEFDYLKGSLKVQGKSITDLFIANESQHFVAADFKINGNKLIVFNKQIKKPVAVRFGFTDVAMPNLFNSKGLPVSPFRTDNWNK